MKIILPVVFVLLVLFGYVMGLRIPYHFYQEVVNEGIDSPFLHLRKLPDRFYQGQDYQFVRMVGVEANNENFWEDLHFNDFILPFPVKHPSFRVAPWINKEGKDYVFGVEFLNFSDEVINRVVIRKRETFKLELYHHKIFQLPLFEKMIFDKGFKNVWKDLFKKDVYQSPYLETPSLGELNTPDDIPLSQMVYDLFILTLRERFFPVKLVAINYWDKRQLGIIEVQDEEMRQGKPTQYHEEIIYFLEGDQIYTIELKTKLEDFMGERYRQRLLERISFRRSEPDSSIPLYASFQNLKYQEKLTPRGLTYLYTAFSHQKDSRNFLSQMIQFLERGRNDKDIFINPLYNYGYQRHGTNFSGDLNKLRETQDQKLKRKVKEEEALIRKKLKDITILDEVEKFESDEEKINFYLQKAKDEGDTTKDGKSLILD